MNYRRMAQVYDLLMADAPYDEWVHFTENMIQQYLPSARSVVDAGCGTGEITHRLNNKGYDVTGVDLSEEMLAVAQQKAPSAKIQWLHQNLTELTGLSGTECIVSYCDVVNYLQDPHEVKSAFQSIYHSLAHSGLFIFDVHSIDHIQNNMIGATFAEVYDDISYIWFCDPGDRKNQMIHDLTFFVREGSSYERFEEQHIQQGYTLDELVEWLKTTGFTVQSISSEFGESPTQNGERLFFVCQKI